MSKRTLSLDLRERVVAAVLGGMSRRQAATRFGVNAITGRRMFLKKLSTRLRNGENCPAIPFKP
jgi:transposase